MNNKLYLDEIKIPEEEGFIVARSYEEDNTLPSGYDFAKCLVEMDIKKLFLFPSDFMFNVHSVCTISSNNIRGLLNNYLLFNTDVYHKDCKKRSHLNTDSRNT